MNNLSGLKKKLIIDVSAPWLLENPPIKMNEKKVRSSLTFGRKKPPHEHEWKIYKCLMRETIVPRFLGNY